MLRLRPYKACDAAAVVSWTGDETSFRRWCADRFSSYPITPDDLNRHYDELADSDSFFEFTAFDEKGAAGHMIMRFTDEEKSILRFGFVIVDDSRRGMGLGKEMLSLAVNYAFDILKVQKITLGVFENNIPAYRCYLSAGFREVTDCAEEYYHIFDEDWKCLEMEMTAEDRNADKHI